ncbi:hypothetical protein DGG96_01540 [Legionella qingyii]|uniref:Uncharacterized protein n=1 Tax=Legionella qingyii TaxID=2184757 RepID=A0A317U929_9GAMM|nr:hypothetical protein [Legionella qingyii]PWY57426.1 hypothetical protein DGG96_01540 [Legionella qingyii]RUR26508.1 hypothetical protein ELY20_00905 [Legionella qingyii]
MKEFIQSSAVLNNLVLYIQKNGVSLKNSSPQKKTVAKQSEDPLTIEQQKFKQNRAARIIQHAYRSYKMKQKIGENPYNFYLSMMNEEEKQRIPAHILFGSHIAEMRSDSVHRINNPYIYSEARYHRDDDLSGVLLDNLIASFNISKTSREANDYIPVTLLGNAPVEDIARRYFPQEEPQPQIIKDAMHSIALVAVPNDNPNSHEIKGILSICGLVASPWEIAINMKKLPYPLIKPEKINPALNLVTTKEALLKSKSCNKLDLIANSSQHTTNKLAKGLKQLLINLPELNENAIQRIALILNMTCLFYENNYPKFAFLLYTIIHEISLGLLQQKDMRCLENDYSRFIHESKNVLLNTLGLEKEQLAKTTFFASLAMSGTNAYVIAMHLAQKMKTKDNKLPTIKVYGTGYYEFELITKDTKSSDADVFIISAGPIVNEEGIIPGIDINQLIKHEFIDRKREKPITVIIDATTALHKNLHLDPALQSLVIEGKLSIIIHESLQKFGLFHTDQAQCGKVYGLCSKESYAEELLIELQKNAQNDFNHHVDLRIGAYISMNCSQTLEEVKHQHFANGALLRNMLAQAQLIDTEVIKNPDMLSNPDELYFVNFAPQKSKSLEESAQEHIESRDSFGHFCTTQSVISDFINSEEIMQTRISADASDTIDTLIQISQLYLSNFYTNDELLEILIQNARKSDSLSFDEQIISLALLNNIIDRISVDSPIMYKNLIVLFASIKCLREQCSLLKDRQYIAKVDSYLLKLQNKIIITCKPIHPQDFIQSIQKKYQQGNSSASMAPQLQLDDEYSRNKNGLLFFDLSSSNYSSQSSKQSNDYICGPRTMYF